MSEMLAWIIVVALGIAIVGFFMLSSQLENHLRTTTEMLLQSNEMILARLDQLAGTRPADQEPVVGAIIERRRGPRRAMDDDRREEVSPGSDRRGSPGRRLEDMLAAMDGRRAVR